MNSGNMPKINQPSLMKAPDVKNYTTHCILPQLIEFNNGRVHNSLMSALAVFQGKVTELM